MSASSEKKKKGVQTLFNTEGGTLASPGGPMHEKVWGEGSYHPSSHLSQRHVSRDGDGGSGTSRASTRASGLQV